MNHPILATTTPPPTPIIPQAAAFAGEEEEDEEENEGQVKMESQHEKNVVKEEEVSKAFQNRQQESNNQIVNNKEEAKDKFFNPFAINEERVRQIHSQNLNPIQTSSLYHFSLPSSSTQTPYSPILPLSSTKPQINLLSHISQTELTLIEKKSRMKNRSFRTNFSKKIDRNLPKPQQRADRFCKSPQPINDNSPGCRRTHCKGESGPWCLITVTHPFGEFSLVSLYSIKQ